jgi:site-specific DNA-methyltransferase (adenine-specific)
VIGVVRGTALQLPFPDSAFDAAVVDPPYGLEFMGKEWDAPWQVGTGGGIGGNTAGFGEVVMPDGGKRLPRPSYQGSPNPTCQNCGGLQRGRADKPTWRPCQCGRPDFPNTTIPRMRAYQAWCELWAREVYRVLKPGGHLLASGGPRTFHRLTAGIEDAGFEIRDCLMHLYGQGFPKSLDVSKAIDKAAGAQRKVLGVRGADRKPNGNHGIAVPNTDQVGVPVTEPATLEAARWQGWGTALKPAWEPIVVARKPLAGSVAQNVLAHGTGGLNVDATRIRSAPTSPDTRDVGTSRMGEASAQQRYTERGSTNFAATPGPRGGATAGRWPANVTLSHSERCVPAGTRKVRGSNVPGPNGVHGRFGNNAIYGKGEGRHGEMPRYTDSDGTETVPAWRCVPECPVRLLDEQSGNKPTAGTYQRGVAAQGEWLHRKEAGTVQLGYGDQGGASRFFATFAPDSEPNSDPGGPGWPPSNRLFYTAKADAAERVEVDGVSHPTVKPLDLVRWLVRLVTPPGGVVLDCFAGSGTTGEAAMLEGRNAVLVELHAPYLPLIRARTHPFVRRRGRVTSSEPPAAPTLFDGEQGTLL